MKKIFILGASMLQVPAIRKAKEKGLYVYALDYDPEAAGIQYADKFLCISTIDKEAVLKAAKEYEPDYIITSTSDMPVRTVAWVNEQLGRESLNDISFEDSICATDKAAMRRRMQKCKVPIPEFHVIHSVAELRQTAEKMKERFIIKPADNAASRGVFLIEKSAAPDYDEIYDFTHKYSRSGEVLVEEFMTGPEVSVESFTVDGETHIITITDKKVTEIPFFVETGHTEPSRLSTEIQNDIRKVTLAAVAALKLQNGPTHTEIKCTPDGARLVEIAARLGGDFITSRLVPLSTGVDLIDCSICSAIGEKVNWERTMSRGSAIRFIQAAPGRISDICGVQEAEAMPGICEVVLYKKTGDMAEKLESSGDRIGHVIAQGTDADDAERKCEAALEKIHIVTGDEDNDSKGISSKLEPLDALDNNDGTAVWNSKYKAAYEIGSEFNLEKAGKSGGMLGMFDRFRLNGSDPDNVEEIGNNDIIDNVNVRFMRCGRDAIGLIADDILLRYKAVKACDTDRAKSDKGETSADTCPVVLMPAISCDSMYLPFEDRGFEVRFYGICDDFSIDFDSFEKTLGESKDAAVLTMNLFGSSDRAAADSRIKSLHPDVILIEDVTHILFNTDKYDISSADYEIGSIRKWLGVPDGAIAICNNGRFESNSLYTGENSFSSGRKEALEIKTEYLETGKKELKAAYRKKFSESEDSLDNGMKPYIISDESLKALSAVDKDMIMIRRRANYSMLRKSLSAARYCGELYRLMPEAVADIVPFMLPILLDISEINNMRHKNGLNEITRDIFEKKLAEQNLYAPVLWPASPKAVQSCAFAGRFSENMIAFWIDQRYETKDMENTVVIFSKVLDDAIGNNV